MLQDATHIDKDPFWHHPAGGERLLPRECLRTRSSPPAAYTTSAAWRWTKAARTRCPNHWNTPARTRYRSPQRWQAILGYTDANLGAALAGRWQFPVELVEAIRDYSLPMGQLPAPRSLTAFVMWERMLARAHGTPNGIKRPERQEPPDE